VFPGGVKSFSAQPHQFAHWGWATALGQLQYQYKSVPEWKLAEVLPDLRVLVIPEAEVFPPADVTLLNNWINSGGRLIVTGLSSRRQGESGNFDINPGGYSLSPLTGVTDIASAPSWNLSNIGFGRVLYIRDNIGMDYYNASTAPARVALLPDFENAMDDVLDPNSDLVILTPGSGMNSHVGLTVFEDVCSEKLFVDIVNFNINLATDQITDTAPLTFTIQLPQWMHGTLTATVVSPDVTPPAVAIGSIVADRVEITINPVHIYAGIIIEGKTDPDFNNDHIVNLLDFAILADHWMTTGCGWSNQWCQDTDMTGDGTVVIDDLGQLAGDWLAVESMDPMVAYWQLDEAGGDTANDAIGDNHGTLYGNKMWTTGKHDGALYFDGAGDYVRVADNVVFDFADEFTVCAWVRPDIADTNGWVVNRYDVASQDGYYLCQRSSGSGKWSFVIFINGGFAMCQSDAAPVSGVWSHIAGKRDASGNVTLYVNGVPQADTDFIVGLINSSGDLLMGIDHNLNNDFTGAIDDVRVYDRALTDGEIAILAQ